MALIGATIRGFCTWVAFLVGVILGWAWKTKLANFGRHKLSCSVSKSSDLSIPSSPSWSVMSPLKGFGSATCLNSFKITSQTCGSWVFDDRDNNKPCSVSPTEDDDCSVSQLNEEQSNVVTKEGLEHLVQLIEMKDKSPTWIQMMDRSIPNVSYQAWWRDPKIGSPQYRSRTVFEDATPELVRDFFWDDEFRHKWDKMLAHSNVVTEEDLEHLVQLIEMKDTGPTWIQMMDHSIPNVSYQAWWRDPKTGPPQYRSRTVFEDATPELVRDFFWDDEFRPKWDKILAHSNVVTEKDLEHLVWLIEMKDKGPTWVDRSIPNISYQAWRRDPRTGPHKYGRRSVFENATPELVRDFFWDDEFRPKWDTMLAHSATIEECPKMGTMVVKWIRKFSFSCSDREYILCRRIWKPRRSFYNVTKGVPYHSIPGCNKPRRVDLYYSSWCIRAVESRRGDGQLTACEVLLFHHEDMGIPQEIAKLGIRQGMWGAVKETDPGFRAYQRERSSGGSVFMAQINTKINSDDLIPVGCAENLSETEVEAATSNKPSGRCIPKLVIIGGAVVLACSLDLGLFTKAFICGVARRFTNMGKRT